MDFKKTTTTLFLLSTMLFAFSQREANTHDGFFLNLSLGANFGKVNTEVTDVYNLDFTGSGAAFDLLIGGTPVENIAIHATLAGVSIIDPDLDDGTTSVPTIDTSFGTGFFGAGATFYTNDNFFFSPNIGRSTITVDNGTTTATSDGGLGIFLRAGKEWWVGAQWGLGLSVAYRGGFGNTDLGAGNQENWSSGNFSISFSATVN